MDTPNLPENEIEEITWQDDENRATLFLRSVFVLLSGALILGTVSQRAVSSEWIELIYFLGMYVVLPVCIIWLFFGQGLRTVEWLTDQKYNAWNYGVNFADWKVYCRWIVPLLIMGILESIFFKMLIFDHFSKGTLGGWEFITWGLLTLALWFLGICLTWFVWGYLWFGCAQGFGAIAATVVTIIFVSFAFIQYINPRETALLASACFIPLALFCSYICWKQKSWIPILYAVILLAPIASFILIY